MNDDRADLPVLRPDDLPELRRGLPLARPAAPVHARWQTIASQAEARAVAVSRDDGTAWLATAGGVLRWRPGLAEFTRYGSEHGLPGNACRGIAVDGQDRTWALGDQGRLCYRDGDAWRMYAPLAATPIACLAAGADGRLWAASPTSVWAMDDPTSPPAVAAPGPDPLWQVVAPRALAAGGPGDVWLCNAAGVFGYDGAGWHGPLPPRDALCLARQGDSLWLGAASGLRRLDLATRQETSHASWPKGPVTALAADEDGLWAACNGQVGHATTAGWQPLADLRLGSPVTGLAPAGAGRVWITTHDGLWRAGPDGRRLIRTEAPPELIETLRADRPVDTFNNLVQALASVLVDGRPALWIGAPRGLVFVDLQDDLWRAYSHAEQLQDVRALASGPGDELWAASWAGGLRRLQGSRPAAAQPAPVGIVLALAAGAGGPWAAVGLDFAPAAGVAADGLYRWDGAHWVMALPGQALRDLLPEKSLIVQAVAEAADRRLWLGTPSGLFGWRPGEPAPSGPDASLGNRDVRAVLALDHDELCIGVAAGLFVGKPGALAEVEHWPDARVTCLAWEPAGQAIWCGTDAGLLRLARQPEGWQIEAIDTAGTAGLAATPETAGLAATPVTALAVGLDQASRRCLWIGTPSGISRLCLDA